MTENKMLNIMSSLGIDIVNKEQDTVKLSNADIATNIELYSSENIPAFTV
jgi:hypothetical protein